MRSRQYFSSCFEYKKKYYACEGFFNECFVLKLTNYSIKTYEYRSIWAINILKHQKFTVLFTNTFSKISYSVIFSYYI